MFIGGFSAQHAVAKLQITTAPPQSGPGFDGLDSDSDGLVSFQEFKTAAEDVRHGGTLTMTSNVARSSIESVGVEATNAGDQFMDRLRKMDLGFDAAAEFERVLAAIDSFGVAKEESYSSIEVDYSDGLAIDADPLPEDPELADLRERALKAVQTSNEMLAAAYDPYSRATVKVFNVADSDASGSISRAEFNKMKEALYGDGRGAHLGVQNLSITAEHGYAKTYGFGLNLT